MKWQNVVEDSLSIPRALCRRCPSGQRRAFGRRWGLRLLAKHRQRYNYTHYSSTGSIPDSQPDCLSVCLSVCVCSCLQTCLVQGSRSSLIVSINAHIGYSLAKWLLAIKSTMPQYNYEWKQVIQWSFQLICAENRAGCCLNILLLFSLMILLR